MTQARWWNRSFLSSIPYRSINLTTTYKAKYIYGSPESNREVLAHSWNTRSRINALNRVRRGWVRATTLIAPIPRWHSSVPKEIPSPTISLTMESESAVSKLLGTQAVQDAVQEAHFFLAPSRILKWLA